HVAHVLARRCRTGAGEAGTQVAERAAEAFRTANIPRVASEALERATGAGRASATSAAAAARAATSTPAISVIAPGRLGLARSLLGLGCGRDFSGCRHDDGYRYDQCTSKYERELSHDIPLSAPDNHRCAYL